MPDVTLKSGRVVTVDVSQMTVKEWRGFISPTGTNDEEDALLSKVTGLPIEELRALTWLEFRELAKGLVIAAQDPLAIPN